MAENDLREYIDAVDRAGKITAYERRLREAGLFWRQIDEIQNNQELQNECAETLKLAKEQWAKSIEHASK